MQKKRHLGDPPLSVRVRKVPSSQGGSNTEEFAIFMTDLDGDQTVVKGKDGDQGIFQSVHDQRRNDDRRAQKTDEIVHHQKHFQEPPTASTEAQLLKKEAMQEVREDLKRILATFDQKDPARSVLAYILASGVDWDDTKAIADGLGLEIRQVTVAKRKIKRCTTNKFAAMRKHILRVSGF